MSPAGGVWAVLAQRTLRIALANSQKVSKVLRQKLTKVVNGELQPIVVRAAPSGPRQPIHPIAFLRQSARGTKWYTTGAKSFNLNATLRRFFTSGSRAARTIDRPGAFLKSNITRAVWQSAGRAPFASALRPNLTGGALPRTAGGYGLGGRAGARYFSHTPAAPAQVVQNVSQAMRAFWLSGQRAHFDGCGPRGENRYRAVSAKQAETSRKIAALPKHIPGAFIDFRLSPTITALSPLAAAFPYPGACAIKPETATSLSEEGFLDILSVDFARALKDMTAILNDLKRLEGLGDLPISLENGSVLRVRFPGVDADTIESLCADLGITRGVVEEDPDFDSSMGVALALRFPFAPDAQADTISSPGGSMRSHRSEGTEDDGLLGEFMEENPWLSEEDGYESMSPPLPSSGDHCSGDFEGLEGIYRFIEECDRTRGRI